MFGIMSFELKTQDQWFFNSQTDDMIGRVFCVCL